MAYDKQYDEDLKRSRLDTCRVDKWLIQNVVNKLCEAEYCNEYGSECPEVYIQAYRN